MEKKRSQGVTFWAWSYIFVNLIGLVAALEMPQSYPFIDKSVLKWIMLYALATVLIGIIVAVNILRLKEWARRLILVLIILGFFEIAFFIPLNHRAVQVMVQDSKTTEIFEKAYDNISPDNKARLHIAKEEYARQAVRISAKAAVVLTGIVEGAIVFYLCAFLLFMTISAAKTEFN